MDCFTKKLNTDGTITVTDGCSQLSDITQDVKAIVVCTQTEYDLLTPVVTTLYIITE